MALAAIARPVRHMSLGHETTVSPDQGLANRRGGLPPQPWIVRYSLLVTAGAIVLIWAAALFVTPRAHILIDSGSLNTANATAIFALRFIAAGILFILPPTSLAPRFRWIGVGLVAQSIGSIVVSRGLPWAFGDFSNKQVAYGMAVVWSLSIVLWLVGLIPERSCSLSLQLALVITLLVIASGAFVSSVADSFPPLVSRRGGAANLQTPMRDLTFWHWLIASLPIALTVVCVVFTIRRLELDHLGTGLGISLIFFAGSSTHYAIWPAAFGQAITSTNCLRLISIAALLAMVLLHLHRVAFNQTFAQPEPSDNSSVPRSLHDRSSDLGTVVAHELGSSIAAVRGYLEILSLPELEHEERQRSIENIRSETVVLRVLAEDIQSLGTVQQQLLTVSPFPIDLGVIIGDAVGFARALPGDHHYRWPDSLRMKVLADPERVAQVFRNLLTNAAKYTRPDDTISIAANRRETTVSISVIDHGPGISSPDETRIFDKFDRGSLPSHVIPGSGVGLFISREIIRLHGHELTHAHTPGGGATFTFELDIVR